MADLIERARIALRDWLNKPSAGGDPARLARLTLELDRDGRLVGLKSERSP